MKIIKKNYEFTRIFRRGKRASTKHLCLVWLIKNKKVNSRFAVTVARLQYGARQRNHLKRLLREIARNSSGLNSCLGLDIILIARGRFSDLNYHILKKILKNYLNKIYCLPYRPARKYFKKKYRFHAKQQKMMKKLILKQIRNYQLEISPKLPRRCRFYPTCSQYAYEAIEMNGLFLGGLQAFWRLLRCQPLSRGGYDPVKKLKFPK